MNVKVYFQHRTDNEQWDFYPTQVYMYSLTNSDPKQSRKHLQECEMT